MSLSKYLIIGAGLAVATAGILYLSKESDQVKFDPKVHTAEKLLKILDELFLEYSTSYVYYYTLINNLKEQGKFTPDILENAKTRIEALTRSNDEDVAKRHNISPEFLQAWTANFAKDPKVAHVLKDLDDLADQVFVKQQLKEMHFHLPDNLTRETYLQIARKVQAAFRHSIWKKMQAKGVEKLTNQEIDSMSETIQQEEQEGFRRRAMELYNVRLPEGELPKQVLQKAYLKFSTVSSITEKDPNKPAQKSHWNAMIQTEQKQHAEILNKLQHGERVQGIEKDPLESAEVDIVVEYNNIPGFLRREQSTMPQNDDKLRMVPHEKGVDTVRSVLDKYRKRKDDKQKKQLSQQREHEIQEEPLEEAKTEEQPVAEAQKEEQVEQPEESKEEEPQPVKEPSPEKLVENDEDVPVEIVEEKIDQPVAEEAKHEEEENPPTESKGYVEDRKELEDCEEAKVAQDKPYKVNLKKGETYYYCTCGRSKNQPFCDGSHNEDGCTFKPLKFVFEGEDENPDEEQKVSLCGCKHNKPEKGPFCDGSHKNLKVPEW